MKSRKARKRIDYWAVRAIIADEELDPLPWYIWFDLVFRPRKTMEAVVEVTKKSITEKIFAHAFKRRK